MNRDIAEVGMVLNNGKFRELGNVGGFAHMRQQSRAEHSIFDHKAHWAFFDFGVVKGERKRRCAFTRATVRHPDPQDRLRLVYNVIPNTQRGQYPL